MKIEINGKFIMEDGYEMGSYCPSCKAPLELISIPNPGGMHDHECANCRSEFNGSEGEYKGKRYKYSGIGTSRDGTCSCHKYYG